MTPEEKIKGDRANPKSPMCFTVIDAEKWTHMSKNTIYTLINESKLIACQYYSTLLILKADIGAAMSKALG